MKDEKRPPEPIIIPSSGKNMTTAELLDLYAKKVSEAAVKQLVEGK